MKKKKGDEKAGVFHYVFKRDRARRLKGVGKRKDDHFTLEPFF